jgi:Tfp pilus assembly protein PilF
MRTIAGDEGRQAVATWARCSSVLLSVALALSTAPAQQASKRAAASKNAQPQPRELFKLLSPSVFVVETLDAKGTVIALGSGVVAAKEEIVTNRHVVEGGKAWRIRQGSNTWTARIAFLDSEHDLCGLRVEGVTAIAVNTRASSTLSVGERVYALGSPEGLELSLSEGLISGIRKFEGVSLIQTTAPISHGSSGGGLFDEQGKLVGITTFAIKDGQNINFAIPTELVLGLKDHPATELRETEAERSASQAMLLSQMANDALQSGDYEKALQAYKQMAQLTPNDPGAWFGVGEVSLKLNRLDSALQACERAVQVGPEEADSWNCLGDAYDRLGRYSEAEQAFKKAIDLGPPDPVDLVATWYSLGIVYAEERKKLGVMDVYRQLKTLDQNYADRFFQQYVQPMLDSSDR